MLCEYNYANTSAPIMMMIQRDMPMPKYKKRYDQYGREDIYGEYDINRVYRAFGYANTNNQSNKRKFDAEEVEIQLLPELIIDGDDSHPLECNEEGGDESSGEYPPGYFEMHTSDGDMGEEQPQCYECIRRQQKSDYQIEDSMRMMESLRDIKNVLLRPMTSPEDSEYYLKLIRNILHNYEETTSIVPNPVHAYDNIMSKRKAEASGEGSNKKRRIRDDTLDIEYKLRIEDTDCFYCTLCDPDRLNTIRINSWEDHCRISTHKSAKADDIAQKNEIKEQGCK